MFKKSDIVVRVFLFFAFLVLVTASILSFILEPEYRTIIPFPKYSIPVINTSSALLCLLALINPKWHWSQYLICFIQAISTTLTGYEHLGTFIYSALIIILFCNGAFKSKPKLKISIMMSIWILTLLGLIPFGIPRMILAYAVSFFYGAFYYFIYTKLKTMLSPLLPAASVQSSIELPPPGSEISFKDYGLTERQIKFVTEYIKDGVSYNFLVEKYFVSLSTVKSEMASIFRIFGVKNKEDLRILLLQYRIKE